jgi:16S rRNA (guanine966-N2)-methyltransferase
MVVWEESETVAVPGGLRQVDQRKYGDTIVTLLRSVS